MREGTAAIVQEAEALGDPVVLENLRYILNAPAGSSDLAFQNGWLRDRAPDGSPLWNVRKSHPFYRQQTENRVHSCISKAWAWVGLTAHGSA